MYPHQGCYNLGYLSGPERVPCVMCRAGLGLKHRIVRGCMDGLFDEEIRRGHRACRVGISQRVATLPGYLNRIPRGLSKTLWSVVRA